MKTNGPRWSRRSVGKARHRSMSPSSITRWPGKTVAMVRVMVQVLRRLMASGANTAADLQRTDLALHFHRRNALAVGDDATGNHHLGHRAARLDAQGNGAERHHHALDQRIAG